MINLDREALDIAKKIEDIYVQPFHAVVQRRAAIQIVIRDAMQRVLDVGGVKHGGR